MQTRFAVVTMYNTESTVRVRYLVACLKKRWAVVYMAPSGRTTGTHSPVSVRESAAREPRVIELRYGVGFVNNEAKAMVEIAMLLRRYVQPPGSSYLDDATEWKVESSREKSFQELTADDQFASLTSVLLRRLYGGVYEGYASRVDDVIANRRNRLTNNIASHYRGMMGMLPGVFWRGSYHDPLYGGEAFTQRRTICANIGRLLARCIHLSRLGENFEGLYNDLLFALSDSDRSTNEFNGAQRRRVLTALQKINNNTIVVGDCGHFAEAGFLHSVGPSNRMRMWCQHCHAFLAVVVVDRPGMRWQREFAVWSERHQCYYSYDIDAMENGGRERSIRSIMEYTTNVTRLLEADSTIHSSHYGDFLMGLELEMTSGNADPVVSAKDVRHRLGPTYCIVKGDGSLPSNGFEIVTAPRGLAEHVQRIEDWEINAAYRAWDTGQCGLHVHIHSLAFTEMTVGKFLIFLNADYNATFLRKLAGRHPLKDHWAARYCASESQEVLDNPKMAVKGKSVERYRIVNLQNLSRAEAERLGLPSIHLNGKYDTLEVRVFKASLRKERLLAQVEFAHAAVMFCRVASYRDLTGKAFLQWLAPRSNLYPHLANWYGTRKSKAIKDAGGKPLEETCLDKSPPGEVPVAPRPPRLAGRLPSGLNDAVLPPVPRRTVRRRPGESDFSYNYRVARERERLAETQSGNSLRRSSLFRNII